MNLFRHSKSHCRGRVFPQLLIFIIGILIGGAVIGEIVRSRYSGKEIEEIPAENEAVLKQREPVAPVQRYPAPVTRRSPVVLATEKVQAAVVSITVTQIQKVRSPFYNYDFFGGFLVPDFQTRYREVKGIGSGVIFDSLGHILTNHHVVEHAAKIMVNLPDGRQFKGVLVGTDPTSDIAVVRVRGRGLPCAKLGRSDDLLPGETVIALGNPFGYLMSDANPTVTMGVISALHRDFAPGSSPKGMIYKDMIQTDASINPGNSGGPLVNIYGKVIGINAFIMSPGSGGSVGIGFAIPVQRARRVAKELIKYGKRRNYWTGLSIQEIDPMVARGLGLDRDQQGVVVTRVQKMSPGDKAGIIRGDVIIGINEEKIQNSEDIQIAFAEFFAGDKVYLIILRGKKKLKVPIRLEIKNPKPSRRMRSR